MVFLWCRGCARKGWQFLKEEWNKVIKGFIEKLTWDPNLRSGSILAVLIHSLLHSPAKISLFVLPCPLECYLQRETKIEPDLRLFKSLFNSKFLQTLIDLSMVFHCFSVSECTWKNWLEKHAGHFWRLGYLWCLMYIYIQISPLPPSPTFQGNKVVSLAEMLKFKNY